MSGLVTALVVCVAPSAAGVVLVAVLVAVGWSRNRRDQRRREVAVKREQLAVDEVILEAEAITKRAAIERRRDLPGV